MPENHNCDQVIGGRSAPCLNEPARSGALFTHSRAITHPSQPIVDFGGDAPGNVIPTIFYGLRPIGQAAHAAPITNVWR
jgi:hypothetical protein